MQKSCCPFKEMVFLKSFLAENIKSKKFIKTSLLYRSSIDGYKAKDFHEKCDGKNNILVLVKANNFLFGGYTSSGWNSRNGVYVKSDESFIFSLSNPSNKPCVFKCVKPERAIFDSPWFSVCFGAGFDLLIGNDPFETNDNHSDLGNSYLSKIFDLFNFFFF